MPVFFNYNMNFNVIQVKIVLLEYILTFPNSMIQRTQGGNEMTQTNIYAFRKNYMKNCLNIKKCIKIYANKTHVLWRRNMYRNVYKRVYEDDNWVVEIDDSDYNPGVRITSFKNNHFVDDIEITRLMMESGLMDDAKDILYK